MTAALSYPLANQGIATNATIFANLGTAPLVEHALANGEGILAKDGPLVVETGKHTGRSAKDKFIVRDALTDSTVWWGKTNVEMSPEHFAALKADFLAELAKRETLYVADLFGGSQPEHRVKVRVINELAWHNLFIRTLLVRPSENELASFVPEYTIIDLPNFVADPARHGCRSETVIAVNFTEKLILIGGTKYAGEMKKSVFGILNYLLPEKGVMPMHCSANIGPDGKTAVFFGLSGTGKTTLSAAASRTLIGDDEHGWSDTAVFNFEGGCYAKLIDLSEEDEPEIFGTTRRRGTVLENVVLDGNGVPDFTDVSKTQNTRGSYPIEFIDNRTMDSLGGHPQNVIFLTCDAFGVLPPISRLTPEQAAYHFISGYTAKVAGTEVGVKEPQATFSACFGEPFMPMHPGVYADLLSAKMEQHGSTAWLINTGWNGGPYGVGKRMKIRYTRAMLNAALDGELDNVEYVKDARFGFDVPTSCPDVPSEVLQPRSTWDDKAAYDSTADKLANMFNENFERYAAGVSDAVNQAAPNAV